MFFEFSRNIQPHLKKRGTRNFLFLLTFTCLHFFSNAWAQDSELRDHTSQILEGKSYPSFNELYSETSARSASGSITSDTRVRYLFGLTTNEKLFGYVGVNVERDLNPSSELHFLENAVSPQIGILYHPLPTWTLWAEYRQRFEERRDANSLEGHADPRVGAATGSFSRLEDLFFESYGEVVWVPRLSGGAIASAYARPFLRYEPHSQWNLDAYSELYGYLSPALETGPSRSQLRAGGRIQTRWGSVQSSLLLYQAWTLAGRSVADEQIPSRLLNGPEALFVIGGIF